MAREIQPVPHISHYPNVPSERGVGRFIKKVALRGAPILVGASGLIYAVSQRGGESSPQVLSIPQAQGQDVPPARSGGDGDPPKLIEVPVVAPLPTEVAPPAKVELKPLPEIINSKTVEFVSLPSSEVQHMIDEAAKKGEFKIALPEDLINKPTFSLVEIRHNRGWTALAVTASAPGSFNISALTAGKITELFDKGLPSVIGFADEKTGKLLYGYIIPENNVGDQVNILVKKGESVPDGQVLAVIKYNPNNEVWESFVRNNKAQGDNAPYNTVAIIGGATGVSITRENILRTSDGFIVVATSQGKG